MKVDNEEPALQDPEKSEINSYLELEETLIPYPDSFDIKKNNETAYILRIEQPFEYEKQVLKSRMSIFDNEDYFTIGNRFSDLVNWYHSTVYNFNDDILDKTNTLIFETEIAISGFIFNQFHKNEAMIRNHLFYNDLILIRENKIYQYILRRNKFLYKGTGSKDEIREAIVSADELSMKTGEYLLILNHPKRGSIIYGERAYQNSLLYAGELAQIIISIGTSKPEIRMRKHSDIYDFPLLSSIGIEDHDSVIAGVFEVHNFGNRSKA